MKNTEFLKETLKNCCRKCQIREPSSIFLVKTLQTSGDSFWDIAAEFIKFQKKCEG